MDEEEKDLEMLAGMDNESQEFRDELHKVAKKHDMEIKEIIDLLPSIRASMETPIEPRSKNSYIRVIDFGD